jgi:hypothetical protein
VCEKEGIVCCPRVDDENLKRARMLQENVLNGVYEHVDLAAYNLNAHAIKSHKKKMFKKQDMKDVKDRVEIMWPACKQIPPVLATDLISPECLDLLKKFPLAAWKVEWMYNGSYDFQINDLYKKRYWSFYRSKDRSIYSKLWDGVGFSKFDIALKMWLETLFRPDQTIRYEGMGYIADEKRVVPQVVRMLTHVYDFDHVVTVTVVTH